jgi:WD40 repeat protein
MRFHFLSLSFLLAAASLVPLMAEPPGPAQKNRVKARGSLEGQWRDLADVDAAKAYQAIWALTKTPKEAVDYIADQLEPAVAPDPRKLESSIDDLNSKTFGVREKAQHELIKLGGLAESALKKRLKADPSLETRQRIEKLLSQLAGPITLTDHLRAVRAVETLENIGSDAAKALLSKYAAGAAGARLTQEAKDAAARLRKAEGAVSLPPAARTDLYGDALPPGVLGRMGTIRFRRNEPSFIRGDALAFSPDDKALVTTGEEHEIQVWDFPSGRLLHEISTRPLYIRGFALAPNGKQLAVAGFHPGVANMAGPSEIRVIEVPSGKIMKSFARTTGDSFQLAFSPDSKLLFSMSSREGRLRIEEIASAKGLAEKQFARAVTDAMAVSPDGAYVALAGPNSRSLYLWKWRGTEPRQIALPANRLDGVSFSPDGKLLAVVEDFGSLFIWALASDRLLFRHDASAEGWSFLGKPVFAPDGKTLAVRLRGRSSFRGRIQLLDPATGRTQATLDTGSMGGGLAFTGDSRILALTYGCGVRFWDMASRKEITAAGDAHQTYPSSIIVSPKGFLVTAGDDGSVRLWDVTSSKQRWKTTTEHWVRAAALSPDGSLVAASSLDDAVYVYDARTGRQIYRLAGHGQLGGQRALRFLSDGGSLASWGDDYYLRVWDMKTGKARLEHAIRPKGVNFPDEEDARRDFKFEFFSAATAFTPDAKTFIIDVARHFHLFDSNSGKETFMFPSEGRMRDAMAISPDGKRLLASSYGDFRIGNHSVSLVDLTSGSTLQRLVLPGSAAGRVAFAADGRSFAATIEGPPGEILVHETASGKVRATIRGFRGRPQALAFFPDGRRLASGQSDSTVLIWDLAAAEHARKKP